MATPIHNYLWPQGEDLVVSLLYKEGPPGEEVPIDLSAHTVRMDIVTPTGNSVFTFNTGEQADPDEIVAQADGYVRITVPRSLTLPGGAIYALMTGPSGILVYNYDIFLRDPSLKQRKLFRGTVTIEPSHTLWN